MAWPTAQLSSEVGRKECDASCLHGLDFCGSLVVTVLFRQLTRPPLPFHSPDVFGIHDGGCHKL